jgi:hypothetical protein
MRLATLAALTTTALPAAAQDGPPPRPTEPIAVIRGITAISDVNANDASGFSPLEFMQVTIEGVVQLGTGVLDPFDQVSPSTWFYVSDATGGVAIAHSGQVNTPVTAGQRVQVTSTVSTQGISPIGGTRTLDLLFGGSVQVVGVGTVDAPDSIIASDLLTAGAAYEGSRVRIADLTVVDPGEWPTGGGSAFVRLTDGVSEIRMYVDDDTDLSGSSPPAAAFDLLGYVAQDDAFPFLDNHYVYPTSLADLVSGDGSGTVTVDPDAVLQNETDVTLAFTFTAQEVTLGSFEVELPADWTWSSPGDTATSGPGFVGAQAGYRFEGGVWVLSVTGANVTSANSGTLTVGSLVAPSVLGSSRFTTRTATPGGTLTEVTAPPSVSVVTGPGAVLINEVYPVTGSSGREEPEFIELRNKTSTDLDIGGWTLADIGRTSSCTLDSRWAFPSGATIPAAGYVLICRTALDEQNPGNPNDDRGFRVTFPDFGNPPPFPVPLYEMYDDNFEIPRMDDPETPNLVLVDSTPDDDQIALLGGPVTNGGQCESPNVSGRFLPFAEFVALHDATGQEIDAIAYQEIGPCGRDFCGTGSRAGEAYHVGPPKFEHTLGRDSASTDLAHSWQDLFPSSVPTPGLANVPGDTVAPALIVPPDAGLSSSMIEIRYDEPVLASVATDTSHYTVTAVVPGDTASVDVAVTGVFGDPEEPGRHFYVATASLAAGAVGTLGVMDIPDVQIDSTSAIVRGANSLTGTATFTVPSEALAICQIQEFDDIGFSPHVGDTVLVAGFVTVGDIPAVEFGERPSRDRVSIWVQEPGGCGVNVFAFLPDAADEYEAGFPDIREFGVQLNDLVQIRGRVTEFVSSSGSGAVTEIEAIADDPGFYKFLLRGLAVPTPVEVTTREGNDERLEGTLVHTIGVAINANALAIFIDDGSGSIQIFQNFSNLDLTRFTVGDNLDVTGIITQFDANPPYFSGYELVPQNQDAIFKVDGEFAQGDPELSVPPRVLVPHLGETIRITATSAFRSDITVEIYDMVGRKVTTLYDGIGLGEQTFDWNGVGQDGSVVEPGAYACHVRSVPLDGGRVRTATAPIIVGLRLK